jgi:hypothetical protein
MGRDQNGMGIEWNKMEHSGMGKMERRMGMEQNGIEIEWEYNRMKWKKNRLEI